MTKDQKEHFIALTKELFCMNTPDELLQKIDDLHYSSLDDSLNDKETIKENTFTVITLKNFIKDIRQFI